MTKKAKAPKSKQITPEGMKVNPFFPLPYSVIDYILQNKLKSGALRCLAFAMKADRGANRGRLKLGIDRVLAGVEISRQTVIDGLNDLVEHGLLQKLNERGDYKLGPLFAKRIPHDAASNDIVTDDELPAHSDSDSYAEKMLVIWNEHVDEHQKQTELDNVGRKRAEDWAEERNAGGSEPIADFEMSLKFFIAHGHKIPLKDGRTRNPSSYMFTGFMKVLPMFLLQAMSARSKDSDPAPAVSSSNQTIEAEQTQASEEPRNCTNTEAPDIPKKYASFIKKINQDGSYVYCDREVSSADELVLVFEHAYSLVNVAVNIRQKAVKRKCGELFSTLLSGRKPQQIVRMIKNARGLTMSESQIQYFSVHPFNFFTAVSLYQDALKMVLDSEQDAAERAKKNRQEIVSGARRKEQFKRMRLSLSYSVTQYCFRGSVDQHTLSGLTESIESYIQDYGQPSSADLPSDIVGGLRCFSTLVAYEIPDGFRDAIGERPGEPSFDWCPDEMDRERLSKKWNDMRSLKNSPSKPIDSVDTKVLVDEIMKGPIKNLKDYHTHKAETRMTFPPFPNDHYMNNSNPISDEGEYDELDVTD